MHYVGLLLTMGLLPRKKEITNRNIVLLNPLLNLEQDDITTIPKSSNNIEMLVFEPIQVFRG